MKRGAAGVLGLGIIGSQVAAHLEAAGFETWVWNRTRPALGVPRGWKETALEVVESCKTVQLFVSDEHAALEVLESAQSGLTAEHVVICSATIGPQATLDLAEWVRSKGASFLEAPFTGSKAAAGRRQLVYYVGGEPHVLERVRPVLEASSRRILEFGKVGDAAVLKVATNLIAAISIQALAEALVLVEKSGIDPQRFAEALSENACRSGTMDLKLPKMTTGDYDPHFSLKNMLKDVDYARGMARHWGLHLGAADGVWELMRRRLARGEGGEDFSVIYREFGGQA